MIRRPEDILDILPVLINNNTLSISIENNRYTVRYGDIYTEDKSIDKAVNNMSNLLKNI